MRRRLTLLLRSSGTCLLLLPVAWATELPPPVQKPPVKPESSEGQFVFSLLPRAFQKNPLVDQTVITEMTDEGKKHPPVSRNNPAYYVTQPGGYRMEGHGEADEKQPSAAELEDSMKRALAVNGYLPASPQHPPSLLIIYHWGSHNNLDKGSVEVAGTAFIDAGHKNLLSRATLVGGSKFANELKKVLEQQDRQDEMKAMASPDLAPMMSAMGPLQLFLQRDPKIRQLYEESRANCYYAVASAYDYLAGVRGERKLLWRSKMTVDAQGVSMPDTLPGLILNAGRYFGHDMPEPATITKRQMQEGQVKLGPLEVKEYLEQASGRTDGKAPPIPPAEKPKG